MRKKKPPLWFIDFWRRRTSRKGTPAMKVRIMNNRNSYVIDIETGGEIPGQDRNKLGFLKVALHSRDGRAIADYVLKFDFGEIGRE